MTASPQEAHVTQVVGDPTTVQLHSVDPRNAQRSIADELPQVNGSSLLPEAVPSRGNQLAHVVASIYYSQEDPLTRPGIARESGIAAHTVRRAVKELIDRQLLAETGRKVINSTHPEAEIIKTGAFEAAVLTDPLLRRTIALEGIRRVTGLQTAGDIYDLALLRLFQGIKSQVKA